MYIVIAGGGKVGRQLVKKLLLDKHTVVVIERSHDVCKSIAQESTSALVICGDSCDPDFLEQTGIERADVIAAVTGDDEDNLVICQLAKERFHVKRSVARVNDSRNAATFTALGVDVPVDSSAIITRLIDEEVSSSEMATLLTLKRGKLAIVRVDIPEDSRVINRQVMDITLPPETVLVSILRGEDVVVPKGNTVLLPGDDVIALTLTENKRQLLELLSGN